MIPYKDYYANSHSTAPGIRVERRGKEEGWGDFAGSHIYVCI